MAVHQHSFASPVLSRADHLSRFELLRVDLPELSDGLKGCRVAFRDHTGGKWLALA